MPPDNAVTPLDHFPFDTIAIFASIFVFSVVIDLMQHRGRAEITARDAGLWSLFWIGLSLAFYGWVVHRHGAAWGSMFLTGYVLEKTLSVDNLMVFIAVFKFFRIESGLQHRILYFGIIGAIVFRFVFVAIGTGFLKIAGPWALLVFGVFVLWAGVQMLRGGGDDSDEETNYNEMGLVRFFRRLYPVFPRLVGDRFFVDRKTADEIAAKESISLREKATRFMTPAFVCLLVIEGSDVLFAFDSVPAVIAVTQEPLLVYMDDGHPGPPLALLHPGGADQVPRAPGEGDHLRALLHRGQDVHGGVPEVPRDWLDRRRCPSTSHPPSA